MNYKPAGERENLLIFELIPTFREINEMDWKTEYFALLDDSNITLSQVGQAMDIKVKNTPQFLYKYRAANEDAFNNLENDTVWLNKPARYNDPFEFAQFIDFQRVGEIVEAKHLDELINRFMTDKDKLPEAVIENAKSSKSPLRELTRAFMEKNGKTSAEIDEFINIMEKAMEHQHKKLIGDSIRTMQEQMKTCSFCESPEQLLMWSHYADHHRGFCVQYDLSKWSKQELRAKSLYPVRYESEIYDATTHIINSITKKDFNNLYSFISGATKSKEWEYEREWRLINNVGPSFEPQNFSMRCQSRVYLGHRIDNINKGKIIEICKNRKLEVFETHLSVSQYHIEFKQVL